jgi:hypothetical protein
MPDIVDTQIARALDAALGSMRLDFDETLLLGVQPRRPRRRFRPVRLMVASGVAITAIAVLIGGGVFSGTGSTVATVSHVGQWTVRVANANAALKPTSASKATIEQAATDTYLALRRSYQSRGVYLSDRPTVEFVGSSAEALTVRFPSGTSLTVPNGPADVWYAEVGAAADPQDPTRQVDMVFAGDGQLIRAFPQNSSEIIGRTDLNASQLADLQWTTVPVKMTEFPTTGCSGPACSTGTGVNPPPPNPNATFTLETATTPDGGTAFALTGSNLNPNDPYYLVSTLGTVGSAKSDQDGSLVAVLTVDRQTAQAIAQGSAGGLVAIQGTGDEIFRACPFGGSLSYTPSQVSCE